MAKTQTTNGKTSMPSQEELAAQVEVLKDDIATLTKLMSDYAGEAGQTAKARLEEAASQAKEKGAATVDEARLRAAYAGEQARDFIHEKPGVALGIAAGVGFLIGALGARR